MWIKKLEFLSVLSYYLIVIVGDSETVNWIVLII